MSNNETVSPESVVTLIYADGSPEILSTMCELFENAQENHNVFKVKFCTDVSDIGPLLSNAARAVILMGGGVSDQDKIQTCHAFGPNSERPVPIVLTGADLGAREMLDYFELGVADYLVEPYSQGEIVAKVHHVLMKPFRESIPGWFENRYESQGLLGKGGFGCVYLALDHSKSVPQKVALKLYSVEDQDTTFRSRFLQEAFQLSRINHPNIVRLLDFGKTEKDYFLVTEYVNGTTLEDVHAEHGILSEYQAALVGYYVGSAINHMSHASIVHRDLSPRNIMLTHDGDVKVIDFGLAKTHMAATLNTEDQFQGTPYFISPEQILGEDVGTAADLYSLAVTIYFMLTGNFPFDGEDAHAVVEAHLNDIPLPLLDYIPDLDPEFSEMISLAFALNVLWICWSV